MQIIVAVPVYYPEQRWRVIQVKPLEMVRCPGCENPVIKGARICEVCGFNMASD